mmetsp:Transcript_21506/g.52689  ORF Transcript_21506/g.52689 Transcript_21506/m.52689 type:complete len:218 (-) Transcript_21506:43-696(-)
MRHKRSNCRFLMSGHMCLTAWKRLRHTLMRAGLLPALSQWRASTDTSVSCSTASARAPNFCLMCCRWSRVSSSACRSRDKSAKKAWTVGVENGIRSICWKCCHSGTVSCPSESMSLWKSSAAAFSESLSSSDDPWRKMKSLGSYSSSSSVSLCVPSSSSLSWPPPLSLLPFFSARSRRSFSASSNSARKSNPNSCTCSESSMKSRSTLLTRPCLSSR